ncbi:restriction endonuclease subunit S [Staphylococcus schleiferi]|uniref:restriction endonuclease subunit S n=1 Tax=Staphylococcus TaxID=1279 RepID=UPI00067A1512|nr:restriction endonuclease subunit S [Staphylococcus coagulans]AKS68115.1 restriction endonuclease subunit S [Staphylococcus schleiferi]AKS72493.1 restriction endonuclease subunit S [Staphylococcus schleiferi]MBT2832761.1 restriction endonuclease subunit S [Staphylococcus coagulans]PNZ08782.1 restriction endonuclease subunit S [Staphylococcus coagulans]
MEYNVQLNKLSTYIYRGKQPKYATEGIPVINQKAIQWDTFDKSVLKYHDENKKVDKRHFIKKNDVLINSTGTGTVGRVYHINYEPDLMFADSHITIVRTNEELLMSRFLYYQMRTTQFQAMILNEFLAGSTGQVEFNKSMIEKLPINVPSISYQYKVVNILSKLDKKIETNKKIIANLEELSQTLFKRWFVDFEFPDENGNPYKSSGGEMVDSELGEIPRSWKVDELGNYIKIKSGKRPKNKVDKKDIENVVPIIGASKIMGYTNDYLYNEKIIIIGRVGTHGVIQRFSTRTWPSDNTFVITSDFESIIYQVLKSIDYISLNRGSTQPLLSQKDIKNTKVVMPTNATLLSKYQKENNHILKMMDQKNIENQKLAQLRDTLLPKLMSGEIEIPDDIEVMEDELSI